jgi:hypothetical protein
MNEMEIVYDSEENPLDYVLCRLPIKIFRKQYECGCWARMHLPKIICDHLEVEAGIGYQEPRSRPNSRFRCHTQHFAIMCVTDNGYILQIRAYGDFGEDLRHYLVTREDGIIRIERISRKIRALLNLTEREHKKLPA